MENYSTSTSSPSANNKMTTMDHQLSRVPFRMDEARSKVTRKKISIRKSERKKFFDPQRPNEVGDAYMKCNLLPIALSPLICSPCSQLFTCVLGPRLFFGMITIVVPHLPSRSYSSRAVQIRDGMQLHGHIRQPTDSATDSVRSIIYSFQISSRVMELEP